MHRAAGEFFQITSCHGTALASETTTGEVVCRRDGDMNFEGRRLIGYVSPFFRDAIFLTADPSGSRRLVMHPGLDCEALLPLGLSWPDDKLRASFYDPELGQWVCAPPFQDTANFGTVVANRDKIGEWEQFDLVPIPSAYAPAETLSLVSRLNTFLREPLSVETVLAALAQDGPILQAIARLMPYDFTRSACQSVAHVSRSLSQTGPIVSSRRARCFRAARSKRVGIRGTQANASADYPRRRN